MTTLSCALRALAAAFVLAATHGSAQIVSFTSSSLGSGNGSAASTVSATTLDPGFTSAIVARGAGLSSGTGTARFNSTNWSTSEGTATNDYISLTLTPRAGIQYTISQISFTVGSSSNINNWSLRSSIDNYASQLGSGAFTAGNTSAVSITGTALSAFTNLNSSTEFRIYAWGATAQSANSFGIGNGAALNIAGSVSAVPEPSTYALLAGIVAALGVWAHRHHRSLPSGRRPTVTR